MKKNNSINRWLWKWHIIAGLITAPLMIMLAVTGIIYMFKADYEAVAYKKILTVSVGKQALSYEQQLASAVHNTGKQPASLVLPTKADEATQFISGMRREKQTTFVDPYTGTVTGNIVAADTLMMQIRKFHGELLLGKTGTLIVEFAASWFVALILTGLYIWWPAKRFGGPGFFSVRTGQGKRLFYRDLHAVTGFWLSVFMLAILAGAMPWTDVFGSNLKWVQKQTDTGYPETWRGSKGLNSVNNGTQALNLDEMVSIAQALGLKGEVTVKLPKNAKAVFTVSNRSFWLRDQQVNHFDQYSGALVRAHAWDDVGFLMEARQIAMRLHQGEYGALNWWALLVVALSFAVSTGAGLVSYFLRKPAGLWGFPEVPENWRVGSVLVVTIISLGVLFPLFGGSMLLIYLGSAIVNKKGSRPA